MHWPSRCEFPQKGIVCDQQLRSGGAPFLTKPLLLPLLLHNGFGWSLPVTGCYRNEVTIYYNISHSESSLIPSSLSTLCWIIRFRNHTCSAAKFNPNVAYRILPYSNGSMCLPGLLEQQKFLQPTKQINKYSFSCV